MGTCLPMFFGANVYFSQIGIGYFKFLTFDIVAVTHRIYCNTTFVINLLIINTTLIPLAANNRNENNIISPVTIFFYSFKIIYNAIPRFELFRRR